MPGAPPGPLAVSMAPLRVSATAAHVADWATLLPLKAAHCTVPPPPHAAMARLSRPLSRAHTLLRMKLTGEPTDRGRHSSFAKDGVEVAVVVAVVDGDVVGVVVVVAVVEGVVVGVVDGDVVPLVVGLVCRHAWNPPAAYARVMLVMVAATDAQSENRKKDPPAAQVNAGSAGRGGPAYSASASLRCWHDTAGAAVLLFTTRFVPPPPPLLPSAVQPNVYGLPHAPRTWLSTPTSALQSAPTA